MDCAHCGATIKRPRKRTIHDLSRAPYRICDKCGKAQPQGLRFNPVRGAHAQAEAIFRNFRMGAAAISFRVMVWGASSTSTSAEAEKRREIKRRIEENGHTAFFSEELVYDRNYNVPLNVQERAQLEQMELVVCLATDFGSMEEAQEFARERPQHFLLWLSEKAQGKYTDLALGQELRLRGRGPIFFKAEDMDSCVIATASADWVEQWRASEWMADNQRRRLDEMDPRKAGR